MSDDEVKLPHTMLGVFATIVGLFAGFLEFVGFIAAILVTQNGNSQMSMKAAVIVMLAGTASALFGLLMSLISLFFVSRRKTFALLGLLINGGIVLVFCVLMALGLINNYMN